MRPRIIGATAKLIISFQNEGENAAETVDRLVASPLTTTSIMETLADWEFPGESGDEQIRPRISEETTETITDAREGSEAYTRTIDRLIHDGEWDGIDVDSFEGEYSEPYVRSLQDFDDWYDKERPPSAYDVGEWVSTLSDHYRQTTIRRTYHAVQAYFKYEIGDWEEPKEPPNREELIDSLQALASDLGETPTTRDVFKMGDDFPGIHRYQSEFGTWNDALRAAGFEPNEEKTGEFTDDELLEDLREFADEIDDVPTSSQMVSDGPHSTSTYITRFGSWSGALEAADLSMGKRYETRAEASTEDDD